MSEWHVRTDAALQRHVPAVHALLVRCVRYLARHLPGART